TQKLIEFAAAIPDPSVLHRLVSSVRREECRWCGLELIGERCAFCATPVARERSAGGAGSTPAAIAGPGAAGATGAPGAAATGTAPPMPPPPTAPPSPPSP